MTIFDRSPCFAALRAMFQTFGTDRLIGLADLPALAIPIYGSADIGVIFPLVDTDVKALLALGLVENLVPAGAPAGSNDRVIRVTEDGATAITLLEAAIAADAPAAGGTP